MRKVLVVDDEKLIVKGIKFSLEQDEMQVDCAYDGEEALEKAKENQYDIILLDVMLPGLTGFEVCQAIREFSSVPIIMLTAKGEDMDKILGLEYGADDYITKPFDIQEALARVEVQLRRNNEKYEVQKLSDNGMMLDKDSYRITIDDRELETITKQEFAILELLLRYPKKVFSKEEIFEYAWEEPYMGETKTLDVHVSNIRKKIKKVSEREYIETVWGIGYRLHP